MREVPYDGLDSQDIMAKVVSGDKLKDSSISQIDKRLAMLIQDCRAVEQGRRPAFDEIVQVLDDVLRNM